MKQLTEQHGKTAPHQGVLFFCVRRIEMCKPKYMSTAHLHGMQLLLLVEADRHQASTGGSIIM